MRLRRTTTYDLVVLGGGTGGLVSAQVAAGAGARVPLVERRGRLVGATVVGGAAGEVIAELTARVKHRDRIDAVSTTVHAYPTMAEGPARAADEYLRRKYAQPLPRTIARLALGARRLTSPTN